MNLNPAQKFRNVQLYFDISAIPRKTTLILINSLTHWLCMRMFAKKEKKKKPERYEQNVQLKCTKDAYRLNFFFRATTCRNTHFLIQSGFVIFLLWEVAVNGISCLCALCICVAWILHVNV